MTEPMHDLDRAVPIVGRSFFHSEAYAERLARRQTGERLFRWGGLAALGFAGLMVAILLGSIISDAVPAFWQTRIRLEVSIPAGINSTPGRDPVGPATVDWTEVVRAATARLIPGDAVATDPSAGRSLAALVSGMAPGELAARVRENPDLIGSTTPVWLTASSAVDQWSKGHFETDPGMSRGGFDAVQKRALTALAAAGALRQTFNVGFFGHGNSAYPEQAGIWAALVGSAFTLIVTALFAIPIGIAAAVYLEEFAPANRWTRLIEININNLAAVPSIVFGLLGLSVLLDDFGLPRSSPLVGGLVLGLMTLPVIIITARAAIRSVPGTIRQAALALGASPLQTVWHHVLPSALPGILTGTIIGLARAMGETAPLLMIGMVAFVADAPRGLADSAAALPVQIYLWASGAERGFVERTAAAILVLLVVLTVVNALAVFLRQRYQRRW